MPSSSPRAATRTRAGSRSSSGASRRSSSARSRGRSKSRASGGPGTQLFRAGGLACRALWLGIAHVIGGAARRIGAGARDIEPEYRRDGLGLLLIVCALVAAGSQWWSLQGLLGESSDTLLLGTAGTLAWAAPLLFGWLAWWVLRHPSGESPTGRIVIGWIAFVGGLLGVAHALAGTPQPVDGADAMRDGGGFLGF